MNIADRLKSFLDQKGINNRDADHRFGFSNGLTGKFLTGKTTLGIDKIEGILKVFPELSADWLIRGRGPMYISDREPTDYSLEDKESVIANGIDASVSEVQIPYGQGNFPQMMGRIVRYKEQVEELQLRLNDKEETITALKETVKAYQKLASK